MKGKEDVKRREEGFVSEMKRIRKDIVKLRGGARRGSKGKGGWDEVRKTRAK